jgi:glyoxylase I family protein
MEIRQFLHTSLDITDLEQSVHFYSEVLHLDRTDRDLKFPGAWYQIGPYQLHLIVSAPVAQDIKNLTQWGRNRHIAFAIDDVQAARAQLDRHHYPYQMSSSGRPALFIQDPDGHVIELGEIFELDRSSVSSSVSRFGN